MKKTVNIRFLLELLLAIIIVVLLVIFVLESRKTVHDGKTDADHHVTGQTTDAGNTGNKAEQTLANDALYLLKLEQDRVVIYHAADGKIYDKTDIAAEVLPEDIRQELQEGMPVYSLKELYDFLENYSS